VFREAGLSRPKQRTLLALGRAVAEDGLDLGRLASVEAREAMALLTGISGIGPWTAEVYLLAAAGHADVFPSGDVALQGAVAHAFALDQRPDAKRLAKIAESWAPWRAVAARLFWAYWREMRGADAAPALETAQMRPDRACCGAR
jgi:DNA-3-methyladenine glycosylase II